MMSKLLPNPPAPRPTRHRARPIAGLSLVELLVALTISLVLIAGAAQVYVHSRNTYSTSESTARLEENARYAMSVLEPDIRMSNYWGLLKGAGGITTGKAKAGATCGANYELDLDKNLVGTNNSFPGVAPCAGYSEHNGSAMSLADTLTIRRASTLSDAVTGAGAVRICSTRASGAVTRDPSTDTSLACAAAIAATGEGQINDVLVHFYYVDSSSESGAGIPSLRRYSFVYDATNGNHYMDEEVIAGVEDMQIQYGVDPNGGLGASGGAATQYLNAGPALDALLNNPTTPAQIVAVRVWLLLRADTPEAGFVDNRIYAYGDRSAGATGDQVTGDLTSVADQNKAYQPSQSKDTAFTGPQHYRRLLICRTIQLRNAMGI